MTIARQGFGSTILLQRIDAEQSIARQRLAKNTFPWQRIDAVIDELFEAAVSLRFSPGYKREFIREFIEFIERGRPTWTGQ
jgi:hypothetical protein